MTVPMAVGHITGSQRDGKPYERGTASLMSDNNSGLHSGAAAANERNHITSVCGTVCQPEVTGILG